ncbi:hypothetical protein VKT23_000446 [Stygiomarasmius scandens]|uniref:Homeobox domain-containing protein n=1 Tax=Marasmiellus scandens TaxID=2682957 RepID=A0ABR1K5C1_9AGAR
MDTNEPGPSNVTFEMSNPAAAARKRVKRITEEGTKIMREAFEQGIERPSRDQKRDLLARITALPGCGEYKMPSLEGWFSRQRDQKDKARAKDILRTGSSGSVPVNVAEVPQLPNPNSRYPSIKPSLFAALETMLSINPEPNDDLIIAWATVTNSTQEDILRWVRDKQTARNLPSIATLDTSSQSFTTNPTPPQNHYRPRPYPIQTNITPTVSNVSSPVITTAFKSETSASPVISSSAIPSRLNEPHARISPFGVPHVSRTSTPVSPQDPAASVLTQRERLLLSINSDIEKSKDAESKMPTSAREFDELFAPYEKIFRHFLEKLEDGQLENWGFQKNMAE